MFPAQVMGVVENEQVGLFYGPTNDPTTTVAPNMRVLLAGGVYAENIPTSSSKRIL